MSEDTIPINVKVKPPFKLFKPYQNNIKSVHIMDYQSITRKNGFDLTTMQNTTAVLTYQNSEMFLEYAPSVETVSVANFELFDRDKNYTEIQMKKLQKYSNRSLISTKSSKKARVVSTKKKRPDYILLTNRASGDAPVPAWPIRESLFPNIPPYILFSRYDDLMNKLPKGSFRHLRWRIGPFMPSMLKNIIKNTGFRFVPEDVKSWMGTWGRNIKSPLFRHLKPPQKFNHFPGACHLGRKDQLWKNIRKCIERYGRAAFGFMPKCFILPDELNALSRCWQHKNGSGNEVWILKPPAADRGIGIRVINHWSQLPRQMNLIVQKYITNPYLINGAKFDMRLYVLVTSFDPLVIYLYNEGIARFATMKYTQIEQDTAMIDRYMHLTNYSINKKANNYMQNKDINSYSGHKWTLCKLWEYLESRKVNTKIIWEKLQQMVIKTFIAAESPINKLIKNHVESKYNCYELFGLDFLMDSNLRLWLLEVNISPSLQGTSAVDYHVKGPLIQTMLNIVQFHLPSKLKTNLSTYDERLYTTKLSELEMLKHQKYTSILNRDEYINSILDNLNSDDVRVLTRLEDEYVARGLFDRIFPTPETYIYHKYMETRYYNRLLDAWDAKYSKNWEPGIKILRDLCRQNLHLPTVDRSEEEEENDDDEDGTEETRTEVNTEI